jgi:hypothetical protein
MIYVTFIIILTWRTGLDIPHTVECTMGSAHGLL